MKRYLLFGGPNLYPGGGWEDFIGAYETLEHALVVQRGRVDPNDDQTCDWMHIVDLETLHIVGIR